MTTPTLQLYLTRVQRLLHDTAGAFWATSELTDYINQARDRTALDSGILRTSQTVSLVAQQETYPIPTGAIEIISISFLWGTVLTPLIYHNFTQLSAKYRQIDNFYSIPEAWGQQGQLIYIDPIPSQAFTAYFDCSMAPVDMVNLTDLETMPYPYWDSVPYYAAYLANIKQADMEKAQFHLQLYTMYQKANAASKSVKNSYM